MVTEARHALSSYGVSVLPTAIGQRAVMAHALIDGRAVTEFDPDSKAASEIPALAQFVEGKLWRQSEGVASRLRT